MTGQPSPTLVEREKGESPCGLFMTDRELHRMIAPHLGWERFKARIKDDERRGFPQFRKSWGGRYWPAVLRWLNDDNGITDHGTAGDAQDGPESFDAAPRQKTRVQARPSAQHLLDGQAGRARPDGLPRLVHRAAGGGR
jgi:hypothetical protein